MVGNKEEQTEKIRDKILVSDNFDEDRTDKEYRTNEENTTDEENRTGEENRTHKEERSLTELEEHDLYYNSDLDYDVRKVFDTDSDTEEENEEEK